MKKISLALAAVMLALLALAGCGASNAKPLSEIYDDIKSQVQLSEMNEITSITALSRYGITEDQVEEFAGGVNNSGVEQEEIVLVKATGSDAAAAVKTALENRYNSKLNENKNYNPEQAAMIEQCSVEQNGLYVSMIISPNAEKITEIYKTGIGQ